MAQGSVLPRKNKNGTTTYYVKFRTADGTQIKRAVGPSRREAERALTAEMNKVNRGAVMTASQETFADASRVWLMRKKPLIELSTFQDYECHLERRLLPAFGELKLRQITRARVEKYVADLDAAGRLSRKTINNSLIPLRQILGRAQREGKIGSNPAASPDRDDPLELPYERPEMHYLSREQARLYLQSAGPGYRPLAEVLIGAGVRISEALALTWEDFDADRGSLRVSKSLKVGGIGTPKGDKARTVVLAGYLVDVLRVHRGDNLSGLIFPNPRTGQHMRRQAVHRFQHRPTLRDAGLPIQIRLHDLRHTAATLWLASGQSIYFAQQQLGHRNIQTTIELYGHPDQDAHRRAADNAASWWRSE